MDDITKQKTCPICQTPFMRSFRANQHHGSELHHDDQVYCSSKCRQKAYRRRSGGARVAVTAALGHAPSLAPVTLSDGPENIDVKRPLRRFPRTRKGEIVADAKWPGMYRIKWRDGRLSDMVNYTRAADALMHQHGSDLCGLRATPSRKNL